MHKLIYFLISVCRYYFLLIDSFLFFSFLFVHCPVLYEVPAGIYGKILLQSLLCLEELNLKFGTIL